MTRLRYIKHPKGYLVYRGGAHLGNVFERRGWWQNNRTIFFYRTRIAAAKKLIR